MAGWSGGRKVIAPGVAHAETITTFHNAAFMAHPRAANCVLDGNPLHEEQLAIVGMLGGALALNTVITSAAGYPLDNTYYQTVKGMVGPLDILEPGGDLIVASACSEGMGSKHYVEAQRRLVDLGTDGFASSIAGKPHADIDEWQTQMQLKPMRVGRVRLYTDGLEEHDAVLTGVERVTDLAGAIADSMARHRDPRVAFVPEGPYVVPVHEAV